MNPISANLQSLQQLNNLPAEITQAKLEATEKLVKASVTTQLAGFGDLGLGNAIDLLA